MGRYLARLAPACAVLVLAAAVLVVYDTGWSAVLRFAALLGVGIALPGTLWWRALRGNVDGPAADASFGTGLGLAIMTLLYLPARMVGVPMLVLAFPVVTVILFVTVPSLRPHWRGAGPRMPKWWGWAVGLASAFAVAVIIRMGFAVEPATFPDAAFGYVDMPYHLALAGELKNHLPPQVPYVAGQPLRYHWFAHAEVAAMSWQTGIELDMLLRRLVPMLVAVLPVVGAAALATRLSARAAAGPIAAWLLVIVTSLDVYGWNGLTGVAVDGEFSSGVLLLSPTHAYGVVILMGTVWAAACAVRGHAGYGTWALLAVGMTALIGAKVTFLPMLAAGAGLAVVVQLMARRRSGRSVAAPSLVVLLALVIGAAGYRALYAGGGEGSRIDFTGTMQSLGPRLGFGQVLPDDQLAVWSSTITFAVSWGVCAAGMIGFARRRTWRDPAAALLIGAVLAGLLATFGYWQWSNGQVYFARAVFPLAIVGSAWGLTVLFDGVRARHAIPVAAAGFVSGLLAALVVVRLNPTRPDATAASRVVAWQSSWPWLLVIGIAVAIGVVGYLLLRGPLSRWAAVGLAVAVLLGSSSLVMPVAVTELPPDRHCGERPDQPLCGRRKIPAGGELVARYVRDHSHPSDVIATNMHCAPGPDPYGCDTRAFWIAAYAERRVLIEGWAYTDQANAVVEKHLNPIRSQFWNLSLKKANDIVFTAPTPENLARLRDRFHVRWLILDRSVTASPPGLDTLAVPRFTADTLTAYALEP